MWVLPCHLLPCVLHVWRMAAAQGSPARCFAHSRFSRCISAYDVCSFFAEECLRSVGFCVAFTAGWEDADAAGQWSCATKVCPLVVLARFG